MIKLNCIIDYWISIPNKCTYSEFKTEYKTNLKHIFDKFIYLFFIEINRGGQGYWVIMITRLQWWHRVMYNRYWSKLNSRDWMFKCGRRDRIFWRTWLWWRHSQGHAGWAMRQVIPEVYILFFSVMTFGKNIFDVHTDPARCTHTSEPSPLAIRKRWIFSLWDRFWVR